MENVLTIFLNLRTNLSGALMRIDSITVVSVELIGTGKTAHRSGKIISGVSNVMAVKI